MNTRFTATVYWTLAIVCAILTLAIVTHPYRGSAGYQATASSSRAMPMPMPEPAPMAIPAPISTPVPVTLPAAYPRPNAAPSELAMQVPLPVPAPTPEIQPAPVATAQALAVPATSARLHGGDAWADGPRLLLLGMAMMVAAMAAVAWIRARHARTALAGFDWDLAGA